MWIDSFLLYIPLWIKYLFILYFHSESKIHSFNLLMNQTFIQTLPSLWIKDSFLLYRWHESKIHFCFTSSMWIKDSFILYLPCESKIPISAFMILDLFFSSLISTSNSKKAFSYLFNILLWIVNHTYLFTLLHLHSGHINSFFYERCA